MSNVLKSFLVSSALALSLGISACSKSTDSSELEEVKQELAELKQEIANTQKIEDAPKTEIATKVEEPSADDIAFQKAKSDGRVRAFGSYAKAYPNGKHLEAADEGAWGSAKRQNSIAAYEAYRFHFPNGKNAQQSYIEVRTASSLSADKTLSELGYDIVEFPSFGALSIDSDGNIDIPEIGVAVPAETPIEQNSYRLSTDAPPTTPSEQTYGSGTEQNRNEQRSFQQETTTKEPAQAEVTRQEEGNLLLEKERSKLPFCKQIRDAVSDIQSSGFSKFPISKKANRVETYRKISDADWCVLGEDKTYMCRWVTSDRKQSKKQYKVLRDLVEQCYDENLESSKKLDGLFYSEHSKGLRFSHSATSTFIMLGYFDDNIGTNFPTGYYVVVLPNNDCRFC